MAGGTIDGAGARDRSVFIAQLPLTGSVAIILVALALTVPALLSSPGIVVGIVLVFLTTGLAIVIPWHRLPRWTVGTLPLADMVAVGLLHLPTGDLWLSVLLILPAVWLASAFEYVGVVVATVTGGTVVALTVIAIDGLRGHYLVPLLLMPICLAFVGATVATRTRRTRTQRDLLRQQAVQVERALERAQRNRRVLNSILNTVDFGIIGITSSGKLRLVNNTVSRLLGLDPRERARPVALAQANGATPVSDDEHPLTRASNGEVFSGEVYWRHPPDADPIALSVSASQNFDSEGKHAGAVVVFSDITAEIEALGARDRLISAVSHELRTPLTSIIGYLDLALDDDRLNEVTRRNLETALSNAERMQRLAADLLAAASTSREGLAVHTEVVNATAIALSAIEAAQPGAGERGIQMIEFLPEKLSVLADEFRLRQVLDNVISNAVKYGRENGCVTVRARDVGRERLITIADDGIGISRSDQERLFSRYFRAPEVRDTVIAGTGLGLSISREIMRAFGGDIRVSSELREGTTVTLVFPLAAIEESETNIA